MEAAEVPVVSAALDDGGGTRRLISKRRTSDPRATPTLAVAYLLKAARVEALLFNTAGFCWTGFSVQVSVDFKITAIVNRDKHHRWPYWIEY